MYDPPGPSNPTAAAPRYVSPGCMLAAGSVDIHTVHAVAPASAPGATLAFVTVALHPKYVPSG